MSHEAPVDAVSGDLVTVACAAAWWFAVASAAAPGGTAVPEAAALGTVAAVVSVSV